MAGWVEEIAGRFDAAVELFRTALVAWREVGGPLDIARVMVGLVGPTIGLGDLEEARTLTEEAYAIFRDAGQPDWLAATGWYLGLIAANEGHLGEAARHYVGALHDAIEIDDAHSLSQLLIGLAAIAMEAGLPEVAAGLLGAADAQLERSGGELFPFARSIATQVEDGLQTALGETRFAARAAGRELAQDEWFAAADAILAASAEAERARQRRDTGLTPREREILELLAVGKTDRQIAEELFVSRRTVNTHVASILGQLGVHSRQDAVAQARQRGVLPIQPDASRYT
jgi:DNA-binding CsgD family transcriptional regulator